MAEQQSIKEISDDALDIKFRKMVTPLLKQISAITNKQNSAMQKLLADIEQEAERLESEDRKLTPDNPYIKEFVDKMEKTFETVARLILTVDDDIESGGIEIGQFLSLLTVSAQVFQVNVKSPASVNQGSVDVLLEALSSQGMEWNYYRGNSLQELINFVQKDAWISKMNSWASGYADAINQSLVNSFSRGESPSAMARKMRQIATNMPVTASENLTRTLQLTSYREASRASYLANSTYLEYKIRYAKLDYKTCPACVGLHGTILKLDERVDDHYRGRCTEWVKIKGGKSYPDTMQADSTPGNRNYTKFQTGEEWFSSLSPERQKQQIAFQKSPGLYDAYKSGIPLSEFAKDRHDDVFGNQVVVKSLKEIQPDD